MTEGLQGSLEGGFSCEPRRRRVGDKERPCRRAGSLSMRIWAIERSLSTSISYCVLCRSLHRRLHWSAGCPDWICIHRVSDSMLRMELCERECLQPVYCFKRTTRLLPLTHSFALQHGFASPTCYTFALSSSSVTTSAIAIQSLPFCGLVPRRSGREPGLVLVYPSGQVRFWDGVEASLTGADRMQSLSIPVGYEETVSEFVRLEVSARSSCSNSVAGTHALM